MMTLLRTVTVGTLWIAVTASLASAADSAETPYRQALAKEEALRATPDPPIAQYQSVIRAYEAIVRRYPTSGYSDNALWQAASLSRDLFTRTGDLRERDRAVRLLRGLVSEYPSSKLVSAAVAEISRLAETDPAAATRPSTALAGSRPTVSAVETSTPSASSGTTVSLRADELRPTTPKASAKAAGPPELVVERPHPAGTGSPGPIPPPDIAPLKTASRGSVTRPAPVSVRAITRVVLPEVVRVVVELDAEVSYHHERIENPSRVFVDLQGTQPTAALRDAVLAYNDEIVRKVRIGRHPGNTTRVVLDVENLAAYSLFTLYEPFRLVIDCERAGPSAPAASLAARDPQERAAPQLLPATVFRAPASMLPLPNVASAPVAEPTRGDPVEPNASPTPVPLLPSSPASNAAGGFSIARQLGLGASRIVIDPGHGGHDPGAITSGVSEAELVLDIALRLEKLLLTQPVFDVVLTRRTDTYVPLEERTAIANREDADLFLSIHANASRNTRTRGVETYFLNFATTADAEAVAARENATSTRTMNSLPDIIRAITLNNKRDESKDFATLVQRALVQQLGTAGMRNLGVKQAPFVVLIGAEMPSILAEVAFVTNRQEQQLLAKMAYRQRIADALFNGILRYQQALKKTKRVARQ